MKNKRIFLIDAQPVSSLTALGYHNTKYLELFQESLKINNLQRTDPIAEKLPNFDNLDGIIVSGSKYSVYESYSWQDKLEQWIVDAVEKNIPFLGICYGHQSLVKAFGGTIEKNRNGKEFGIAELSLSEAGKKHLIFQDMPSTFRLYTSHSDSVMKLPAQFKSIATNNVFPIQAVSFKNNAVGIQAHPEFSREFMELLIQYNGHIKKLSQKEVEKNMNDILAHQEDIEQTRKHIFKNFINMVTLHAS